MLSEVDPIDPRYPIGRFSPPASIAAAERSAAVQAIAELPEKLRSALQGLGDAQRKTPYREGGWTVQQLVHHLADSHMIAFARIRRALTEDMPTVQGYSEKAFAELPDSALPMDSSLEIVQGVHKRWSALLEGLTEEQWKRGYQHTERGQSTVEASTILYAWHCKHHLAHITELRSRMGW